MATTSKRKKPQLETAGGRRAADDPIARVATPSPDEVRAAREAANLTQAEAARLVYLGHPSRWAEYESPNRTRRRTPDLARWELFLVITTASTSPASFAALVTAQHEALRKLKEDKDA